MGCKITVAQDYINKLQKGEPVDVKGLTLEKAIKGRDLLIRAQQIDTGVIKEDAPINVALAAKMLHNIKLTLQPNYQRVLQEYNDLQVKADKAIDDYSNFMVKTNGEIKLGRKAKVAADEFLENSDEKLLDAIEEHKVASAIVTENQIFHTLDPERSKAAEDRLKKASNAVTNLKNKIKKFKRIRKTAKTNLTKKSTSQAKLEEAIEAVNAKQKTLKRLEQLALPTVQLLQSTGDKTANESIDPKAKRISLGKWFSGKLVHNTLNRIVELLPKGLESALNTLYSTAEQKIDIKNTLNVMVPIENDIRNSLLSLDHSKLFAADVTYGTTTENGVKIKGFQNLSKLLVTEEITATGKIKKLDPAVVTILATHSVNWYEQVASEIKNNEWVNRLMGNTTTTTVTPEMWNAVEGVDMLLSKAAQDIGSKVIRDLGITADIQKSELSPILINNLAVELGLLAIHAGAVAGKVRIHSKPSTTLFGTKGQLDKSGKPLQITVVELTPEFREEAKNPTFTAGVKAVAKVFGIANSIKKPRLLPQKKRKVENKSKQSTWFTTAKITQEAINRHENVAWKFNDAYMQLIDEGLEESRDELLKYMDYIDEGTVHVNYVDGVRGKNRSIIKQVDDLIEFFNEIDNDVETEVYFNYFFGKNGRFYMDSNTINMQGYKFQRGALNTDVKVIETTEEELYQNLAFAQAFGIDIDKMTVEAAIKEWEPIRDEWMKVDFSMVTITDLLEMLDNGSLPGKGDTWHNMMGIANFIDYQKFMKETGSIKGMEAKLVAEIDGVTNGYILKSLQMPLHVDVNTHLQSGGVFVGERINYIPNDAEIGKGEFVKNEGKDSGVLFKYKSFGEQYMDPKTSDNYELPAEDMSKQAKKVLEEFKGIAIVNRASELTLNSKLGSADTGTLNKISRSFMKEPFVVFNYGAGMGKILNTLIYGSVSKGAMDRFYDLVVDSSKESQDQVIAVIKASARGMVKDHETGEWKLSSKSINENKINQEIDKYLEGIEKGSNLTYVLPKAFEDNLASGVKAGLGQAMEKAFEPYESYIEAGRSINKSFQAMFRLFNEKFKAVVAEAEAEVERALTPRETDEIIAKLSGSLPAIKTALATKDSDMLMIYKEGSKDSGSVNTDTPLVEAKGKLKFTKDGKPSAIYARTKLSELVESFASGSVIPIHFLDGSAMSMTLTKTDSLGIHDALLVVAGKLKSTAQEYNKAVALLTESYSFTTEVLQSLVNVIDLASDVEIKAVDKLYASEVEENPDSINSIYSTMTSIQQSAEAARVNLLSNPIRYEQMAFEGGHFDWNMEGKPYIAKVVKRPKSFNRGKLQGTKVVNKPVLNTNPIDKEKANLKLSQSNKYIGFGVGSTKSYADQLTAQGFPVNIGEYSGNDKVFTSINGKGKLTPKVLKQTIAEVEKALDAGAIVITDSEAYIADSTYNIGEAKLAEHLLSTGKYKRVNSKAKVDVNGKKYSVGIWSKKKETKNTKIQPDLDGHAKELLKLNKMYPGMAMEDPNGGYYDAEDWSQALAGYIKDTTILDKDFLNAFNIKSMGELVELTPSLKEVWFVEGALKERASKMGEDIASPTSKSSFNKYNNLDLSTPEVKLDTMPLESEAHATAESINKLQKDVIEEVKTCKKKG